MVKTGLRLRHNIIAICLTTLLAASAAFSCAFAVDPAGGAEGDNLYIRAYVDYDKSYDVLDRINKERSKRGIGTLPMDQALMDAAYVRAAETILYFEHARPNGEVWHSVDERVDGENLGMGTGDAAEIMRLWMESPGHKENILRSSFDTVGVACIEYDGTHYWVQLFSRTDNGSRAERPANTEKSLPLDLPSDEEGGEFALDYSITVDGRAEVDEEADAKEGEKYLLGLTASGLVFDPSKIKWSIDDPEIAQIDDNGMLSILAKGRTAISAASGSIERADMEIDSREDVGDLYIMDAFSKSPEIGDRTSIDGMTPMPELIVLSNDGPLERGRDYSVICRPAGAGGAAAAELRGIGGYKGIEELNFNVKEAAAAAD